ncbi:MAG: ABC transporter substrate-binding protein [Candidatus Wallbacteria bacterium]|nr:ABC transporter substrate-binding protein [Candidatus Wallbacteria bacterium]
MKKLKISFLLFLIAVSQFLAGCKAEPSAELPVKTDHPPLASDETVIQASTAEAESPASVKELATSPAYGDKVIYHLQYQPESLNPICYNDAISKYLFRVLYNGLVRYDKDLKLIPDLAGTWEISNDQRSITFTIKPGIKWHDGFPFSIDDVIFTSRMICDQKLSSIPKEPFLNIDTIESLSPLKIKIDYFKASYLNLSAWKVGILPKHICVQADLDHLNRHPIGTGPFRFVEWIPNTQIVLEANQEYFDGSPYLNQFIFKIVPDLSAAFLQMINGEIDLMNLKVDYYVKQADTIQFKEKFNVFHWPSSQSFSLILFNLDNPLFLDLKVRRAINHAVNVQRMISDVLYGYGQQISGPFPRNSWTYDESVFPVKYSTAEASSLLSEAGWKDNDNDGILESGNKEFAFQLIVAGENYRYLNSAKLVIEDLKQIGIKAELIICENQMFLAKADSHNFEAMLTGWKQDEDSNPFSDWHSSSIPEKNVRTGYNYSGLKNSQIDKIIEEILLTSDQEKLTALFHQFHRKIAEELPGIFLFSADTMAAVNKRIKGIEMGVAGFYNNPERWYVPE